MIKRIILFLVIILQLSNLTAQNIQLVFRYDDFILKSDSINEQLIRLFQKHNIPLVLGVIPCDSKEKIMLEPNYPFLPILTAGVQNQSIEIAQHGLNHLKFSNGEFGNLKKEEQFRRMQKGKLMLESIFHTNILTFIPPYNAYDNNTLAVMQQLGIKNISSALCVGQPFSNPDINYFPETIEDFGYLLSVLTKNKNRKGIVVVMFHHYTFNNHFTLATLDSLLFSIKPLKYVKCVTFTNLSDSFEVSDKHRMDANMESNLLSKGMHLNGVIQTTAFATFIRILNLLLYLILSSSFYLLSTLLVDRERKILAKTKYSIGFILLFFIGLSVWFHLFGPLKLIIFVILVSTCIPLIFKIQIKN